MAVIELKYVDKRYPTSNALLYINSLTIETGEIVGILGENGSGKSTLLEAIAAAVGSITIGGELFSDAMGKDGTLEGTYVGMVLHNVDTITRALGGTVPEKKPGALGEYLVKRSSEPSIPPGSR